MVGTITESKEMGIPYQRIRLLGGIEKLRRMDPDARAFLLKPHKVGLGREHLKGGLAARGYLSKVPGKVTHPQEAKRA